MAWIESHQVLKDHPKVARLARAAGWSQCETIGKLHIFWWWCLDYACDGRLKRFDHETIAGVFGVTVDCTEFVNLLIESRWLDSEPEIRVHDWWDYSGRFLQIRYKRKPKIWKEIKRFYGHSMYRNSSRTTTEQQPTNNHKPNLTKPNLTKPNKNSRMLSDDEFLEALRKNPAYSHLDITDHLHFMDSWLLAHPGRKKTRRFIVNWLNRQEKPLQLVKKAVGHDRVQL